MTVDEYRALLDTDFSDVTIGDKITPRQTDYDYAFMITDKSVLAKKR